MTWGWQRATGLLVVVVAIALSIAVRIRLADAPFERDEGEYGYAAQLILQGEPPYKFAYTMKLPGTSYAYSAILALGGETRTAVHLGLAVVNGLTSLLVFWIGLRLAGGVAGTVSALAFIVTSLDRWTMGPFAHATHFMMLPVMAGLALALAYRHSRRVLPWCLAGVLLGVGVLMKQHAVTFVALGAILAFDRSWRCVGTFLAGVTLPFAILLLVLWRQGALPEFWFWSFQYAKEYVTEVPWSDALANFVFPLSTLMQATRGIWMFAAIGAVALSADEWSRETRVSMQLLLVASLASLVPGLYFRTHYYIAVLPVMALCAGIGAASLIRLLRRTPIAGVARPAVLALFIAAVAGYVVKERSFLWSMTPVELTASRYGGEPFLAAPEIADHIARNTTSDQRIAVIGSEPEIYFYARRRAATSYLYMYPMMETQPYVPRMQAEMLAQLEMGRPAFLVIDYRALARLGSRVQEWAADQTQTCFDLVGAADPRSATHVRWRGSLTEQSPLSNDAIGVFRRRSVAGCE